MLGVAGGVPSRPLPQTLTFGDDGVICIAGEGRAVTESEPSWELLRGEAK